MLGIALGKVYPNARVEMINAEWMTKQKRETAATTARPD
jgi:hypothetical protein